MVAVVGFSCDSLSLPRCTNEASSTANARHSMIKTQCRYDKRALSASTFRGVNSRSYLFSITFPIHLCQHPSLFCRHGSHCVGGYLSNPSKALLQSFHYPSFCPAWVEGFATRMSSRSAAASHSSHDSFRGVQLYMLSAQRELSDIRKLDPSQIPRRMNSRSLSRLLECVEAMYRITINSATAISRP